SASYNLTSRAIVNNTVTDEAGKSTFQSINLSDKTPSGFYFYGSLSRKVTGTDLRVGVNTSLTTTTYYNLINSSLNRTRSGNYGVQLSLQQFKLKKYDLYLSAGPGYNTSGSSLQKMIT